MKPRLKRGRLITFEKTCDGLGGTTQAALLADRLRKCGFPVVLSREPGGTDLGTIIREVLLKYKGQMSDATELLLFQADRAQHYKEVIKPALKCGAWVILDRFVDSTLSYQGAGRGWNEADLWKLHEISTGGLLPNLTFVLDGVPHVAPEKGDRFETLGDQFFERVRGNILNRATGDTISRYVILNANQPKDVVAAEVMKHVEARL